jgi:cobalt-zinc-cadmium efflux system protein
MSKENQHKNDKDHGHAHSHLHIHADSVKNIRLAFFLNLAFTIIEIIGGVMTNSLAILSDALHDFGDSVSLGLAWFFEKLSSKKRTEHFSYGYKRFSLLAALINSNILLIGSFFILAKAIPALWNPEMPNAKGMLGLAVLGIIFNGIAVLKLGHKHSINERVIRLHLMEDVLGWVAVLIVSIVLIFWRLPVLDPLLSIGISIYILWNVFRNLKATLKIFLQAVPSDIDIERITEKISKLKNVSSVHDVHIWSLSENYNILTAHLVIASNITLDQMEEIKNSCRNMLEHENIQHTTLEFEAQGEECELLEC